MTPALPRVWQYTRMRLRPTNFGVQRLQEEKEGVRRAGRMSAGGKGSQRDGPQQKRSKGSTFQFPCPRAAAPSMQGQSSWQPYRCSNEGGAASELWGQRRLSSAQGRFEGRPHRRRVRLTIMTTSRWPFMIKRCRPRSCHGSHDVKSGWTCAISMGVYNTKHGGPDRQQCKVNAHSQSRGATREKVMSAWDVRHAPGWSLCGPPPAGLGRLVP